MSEMTASVTSTQDGFEVQGYEELRYGFQFVDNIFEPKNGQLAAAYKKWGRCLLVTDSIVHDHYGKQMQAYFDAHDLPLTIHIMPGGEINKTMKTMLGLVDAFNEFGLIRKEPVLAVGGGLVTDVCGFACASYRRTSNFLRIPTTLIGLIDAAVSIKVGLNHCTDKVKLKNRLGAYHAPLMTFLDFTFLRTLPEGQIRNGFAELVKISSVSELRTWQLLEAHGEALIETSFGRADGAKPEITAVADEVCRRGIKHMLDLETFNLHELDLRRVIAFGHTWSPTLELAPKIPLRHGHAINIDMAFSTTWACIRGYINEEERDEILGLMSRVGLSLDHELFDEDLLKDATEAILKTRDGKQHFVVPKPIGTPHFIYDGTYEEMNEALRAHKELVKKYPRQGAGIDAYVDAGDLGQSPEELLKEHSKANGIEVGAKSTKYAAVAGTGVPVKAKNGLGFAQAVENTCCA